jgi:hypothetical protein
MKAVKLERLPDFSSIEKKVFKKLKSGSLVIGGVEIHPDIRDALREQAKSLDTSQLWEILNASLANEAIDLSLIQSSNFEHVQFAKALWHYSVFMRNVVAILAKD